MTRTHSILEHTIFCVQFLELYAFTFDIVMRSWNREGAYWTTTQSCFFWPKKKYCTSVAWYIYSADNSELFEVYVAYFHIFISVASERSFHDSQITVIEAEGPVQVTENTHNARDD